VWTVFPPSSPEAVPLDLLAPVLALERGMNTRRVKGTVWRVALLWVMGGAMESHLTPSG